MSEKKQSLVGWGLTVAVVAAAVAILNVGVAATSAAECPQDGGGGGGSPSPSGTGSPSGSPSGTGGGPITLPPILPSRSSASPSGSPSEPPGRESQECPTRLTIRYERRSFSGRVKSPNSQCERGRAISVKKDRREGKDRTIGRTVSKRNGGWKLNSPRAKGRFYAQTPSRKVSGGRVTCRAARSKTIRV